MNIDIAVKCGLVFCGKNEEGEELYIGTVKQWTEADKLEDEVDAAAENEADRIREEEAKL